MSLITRKPFFRVCDQVRLKPACSASEPSESLEISIEKLEVLYYLGSEQQGADQTARMRRLIFAFVVRTGIKQVFSSRGSYAVCTHYEYLQHIFLWKTNKNYPLIILFLSVLLLTCKLSEAPIHLSMGAACM